MTYDEVYEILNKVKAEEDRKARLAEAARSPESSAALYWAARDWVDWYDRGNLFAGNDEEALVLRIRRALNDIETAARGS